MSTSSFQITKASRSGIIPLIFVWGGTGGGKTESALRLARGMAGASGRVLVGDTENGRAKICADRIPGGYQHIDFQPPFTPERYCELIEVLEKNADVGVLDSTSHLWSGPDGVLEMHEGILDKLAGDDWSKREAASWRAWKEPKSRLGVFKDRILRCKIPIICCFRGEEKSQLVKDERGKSQIVPSKTTIPIFEKKLIFEATVSFEVFQIDGQGGYIRFPFPYAKVSHNSILELLPKPARTEELQATKEQLDVKHGEAFARWCASPGNVPAVPHTNGTSELKKRLWNLTKPVHGGDQTKLLQFLIDEMILEPHQTLADLTSEELEACIAKAKAKMEQIVQQESAQPQGQLV